MQAEAICSAAVEALEDIKAEDITVMDVRGLSSLFDYIVVASAESTRQTRAFASNMRDKLRSIGADIIGIEGEDSGEWVLVDIGDVVVHVMQPAVRAHYNLEQLWGGESPRPHAASVAAAGIGQQVNSA